MVTRLLALWSGLDTWRAEAATVDVTDEGVRARGTQLGVDPLPYRLDYRLDAGDGFITRRLDADVIGSDWSRRLRLARDEDGAWRCQTEACGDVSLPSPGGSPDALTGALDCDLGLSPLTNLMPIRRHGLHQRPSGVEFLMAWVSVPDLGVHASVQRYEHVHAHRDEARVKYLDLGLHRGFTAELQLDRDGLVLLYPQLALRVGAGA